MNCYAYERLTMCNDFGNRIPYSAYVEEFSHLRMPVLFPLASPNLEPRDDIWPTETAPVIRQVDDGIEFTQLRWGFPPAKPKGPPVINFRSGCRRFPKGLYLVPASHFFEFTGAKPPKSKWKFTKTLRRARTGFASPVFGGLCRTAQERPSRFLRASPAPKSRLYITGR